VLQYNKSECSKDSIDVVLAVKGDPSAAITALNFIPELYNRVLLFSPPSDFDLSSFSDSLSDISNGNVSLFIRDKFESNLLPEEIFYNYIKHFCLSKGGILLCDDEFINPDSFESAIDALESNGYCFVNRIDWLHGRKIANFKGILRGVSPNIAKKYSFVKHYHSNFLDVPVVYSDIDCNHITINHMKNDLQKIYKYICCELDDIILLNQSKISKSIKFSRRYLIPIFKDIVLSPLRIIQLGFKLYFHLALINLIVFFLAINYIIERKLKVGETSFNYNEYYNKTVLNIIKSK